MTRESRRARERRHQLRRSQARTERLQAEAAAADLDDLGSGASGAPPEVHATGAIVNPGDPGWINPGGWWYGPDGRWQPPMDTTDTTEGMN